MSDRLRTVTTAMAAVALLVATVLLVGWLRDTAPVTTSEGLDVTAAEVPSGQVLECSALEGEQMVELPSLGRATSGEIMACPIAFDGLLVTYAGEVVGDILRRDGGSWLLVNDDDYALETGPLGAAGEPSGTNSGLAVWVPSPADERITAAGRAGLRGEVIEITGTVRRADPDDGGGLTIRATEVTVLAPAVELDVPVHWRQVGAAVALAAVAVVLTVRDRRRDRS